MKTSTQLKALIRNLSKEKNVQAEVILRNFMLERLLERISLSAFHDRFILKGGMLIASIVSIGTRSTMDMDTSIRGMDFTREALKEAMEAIVTYPLEDDVTMTLRGFEDIRDESDYPGIRVSIEAVFDKTKQVIKVDITTGDTITPGAKEYSFKLLLEDRNIKILAYNLETILAEKLETVLSRSTANTRMRDYYDISILTTLREQDIDWTVFTEAFRKTSEKRGSYDLLLTTRQDRLREIERSTVLSDLWTRYQQKNNYVRDIIWHQALVGLNKLYIKAFGSDIS